MDVSEFDFPFLRFDILLKHGSIILRVQGFNVVSIIGLNTDLAQVGDLAIQVTHTSMYMKTQLWLKTRDGAEVGHLLLDIRTYIISQPSSFDLLSIELHEQVEAIPRVGDLWVPVATMFLHH